MAQYGEMLGKRGLGQRYALVDLADGQLAAGQAAKDHQAGAVRQRLEEPGSVVGVFPHLLRVKRQARPWDGSAQGLAGDVLSVDAHAAILEERS